VREGVIGDKLTSWEAGRRRGWQAGRLGGREAGKLGSLGGFESDRVNRIIWINKRFTVHGARYRAIKATSDRMNRIDRI